MNALVALVLLTVAAQEPLAPEQCRIVTDAASAVTVMHAGKPYRLANEPCRAQFLSDPERYSQLYDALAELEAAGRPAATARASLVPS
ncbi:MAG TPA: hypothetical protein VEK79_11135 [Thermoanaerobaculia bacterium]|nr:hypothetical protein [Thermoanaerobaculia bacterium]